MSRLGARWIGAALVCAWPMSARAAEIEVTSDVAAQGYEVASPWGDVVLGRRRLLTTLGLGAYHLQGDHSPFEADYSVVVRMRVDADFGLSGSEYFYDPRNHSRYVPGLTPAPFDIMVAYVEGRDLLDGLLTFRVGRQYQVDVLGWWSFDGGLVRVVTPFFLQAEVYGGFEQRGGLPLSTSRFESQGVWRGDQGALQDAGATQQYPSFQAAALAPAVGVALESNGPNWIHGRLDYRRVYSSSAAFTSQFPAPSAGGYEQVEGLRTSSERVGYALTGWLAEIGSVHGGFAYDLYNQLMARVFGGVDLYLHEQVTLSGDYEYFVPTFDADSIWNWFTHNPSHSARGRLALGPWSGFDVTVGGGARLWLTDGDPESWAVSQCAANNSDPAAIDNCIRYGLDPSTGGIDPGSGQVQPAGADGVFSRQEASRSTALATDLLASVGSRYRWGSGMVGIDGNLETGVGDETTNRGHRGGATLSARQALAAGRLWVGGRLSAYDWADPTRPDRDATSFAYVLAPEYAPVEQARLRLEWEHDMNRLVGHRFRLLGLVSVNVGGLP